MTKLRTLVLCLVLAPTALAAQTIDGEQLDLLDANVDGAITYEEFSSKLEGTFRLLDQNSDGVVSWSEAQVTVLREQFDTADANGDGTLSRQEFLSQVQRDFQAADRDRDGVLD